MWVDWLFKRHGSGLTGHEGGRGAWGGGGGGMGGRVRSIDRSPSEGDVVLKFFEFSSGDVSLEIVGARGNKGCESCA